MLAEYEFMTRGVQNFMQESETRKEDIELVVSFFEYIFYFPLLFGFIFINSVNICLYMFICCVQN